MHKGKSPTRGPNAKKKLTYPNPGNQLSGSCFSNGILWKD
ncbi:putative lipoprotein [Leptospira terpstrae serovar Hualin str. LT 11-33 = ATCC 700639]|uniref:Lipoprotein n=1 Tax=Leptospira terpstrae serovar Hualin str. LT 11-33 = ATCC 700639 TaxID=1257025 RepID=N1VTN9_9LEPT|nr:putative lipoprotein [Leptospira terpstrae serovar Hualin str. LT 11-33 = ATCC 700639]